MAGFVTVALYWMVVTASGGRGACRKKLKEPALWSRQKARVHGSRRGGTAPGSAYATMRSGKGSGSLGEPEAATCTDSLKTVVTITT